MSNPLTTPPEKREDSDEYIIPVDKIYPFRLSDEFLEEYKQKEVPWGYGDLSYVTYKRTYARPVEGEDRSEHWFETCKRVIEFMYNVQKARCKNLNTPWDNRKAQRSAKEAYDRMFHMKWLPPGRGLWNAGAYYTKRRTGACLNNCAFSSTENIDTKFSEPFVWMMSMSMLGVGVGFDTRGKGKVEIQEPEYKDETFVVHDSREGWCELVEIVLDAYVGDAKMPQDVDYSNIRKKGEEIETFGGVAPGPEPLKKCKETLINILNPYIGKKVDSELIVDLMNIIGRCVVSGGLRRCMKKGSEVLTKTGCKAIEDVKVGDEVVTNDGYKKVKNNFYQGKQNVVKVSHQNGSFVCTPDHRVAVLTSSDDDLHWKYAKDLTDEDKLMFCKQESGQREFVPVEVNDIKEHGVEETYDLEVEEEHNFVCENVLVHNSAQLALGEKDDEQYLNLKEDKQKVEKWRWASNNSIFADVGMDYKDVVQRTQNNGEPGYIWLENARKYGRMKDEPNWDDKNVKGFNPCGEQPLENRELCCLVETFPKRHETIKDFKRTLKFAYLYAKCVTLVPTHDQKTNEVMLANRRIGCSASGIVQAVQKHGRRTLFNWFDEGYDRIQELDEKYSNWLCVPKSVKTTTVKPSGTTSILAGATPGVHWDHSPYYIRRVRIHDSSPLLEKLEEAGYDIEEDVYADDTKVVSFPVSVNKMKRGKSDVSIWEKVELVAAMQHYWSDNSVSATISFDKEKEADDIPRILEFFEHRLKTLSFLPSKDHGYEQAPYEEIDKETYESMKKDLKPISDVKQDVHDQEDKFCSGEACKVDISNES